MRVPIDYKFFSRNAVHGSFELLNSLHSCRVLLRIRSTPATFKRQTHSSFIALPLKRCPVGNERSKDRLSLITFEKNEIDSDEIK